MTRSDSLRSIRRELLGPKVLMQEVNEHAPWGARYQLADSETADFVSKYFPEIINHELVKTALSPTVVVILPGQEIPPHFHERRTEIVKVLSGSLLSATVDRCGYFQRRALGGGGMAAYEQGVRHQMRAHAGTLVMAELWSQSLAYHLTDEHDTFAVE